MAETCALAWLRERQRVKPEPPQIAARPYPSCESIETFSKRTHIAYMVDPSVTNPMEIDPDKIREEIEACRNRLIELCPLVGEGTTFSKRAPRISVGVTRAELEEIQNLARRHKTSPSALGQLALRHLVIQARSGALPMVPPSTLEAATEVTVLGNPVP
jgi:hypothetical protein